MRAKTIICFAILMSVVLSINGQTPTNSGPHFCEAFEANNRKIDYTIATPRKSFHNFISIRGLVWNLTSEGPTPEGGNVSFVSLFGSSYTVEPDEMFGKNHKCAFNVRRGKSYMDQTSGVVTEDYRKVLWIRLTSNRSKWGTTTTKAPQKRDSTDIENFNSGFDKNGFRPHVAFNTMANINSHLIFFIETTADDKTGNYRNRFQIYDFPVPEAEIWTNVTESKQKEIPISIRNTASKYIIKGVLPVQIKASTFGSAILVELCPTNEIPCPQTVTYKYCVVADNEANPTDEGKPCHQKNLKLLYDCTEWINNEGNPEVTTIPTTIEEESNQTERETTTTKIEATETTVTPSASEEPKSGMGWLWILLIVIILVILLIALLLFCCLRRKSKEPKEAPVPPPDDTEENSMATMEAQPKSGLPESTSTLSTASNRSGVDGQSSKVGADKSQMSSMPSSLSTTSNRSGVNNSRTGQSSVGSQLGVGSLKSGSSNTPSSLSTNSTRSGVNKSNAGQSSTIGPNGSNGSTPNGSQTSNITPSSMSTASTRSGVKNSGI